MFPKHTLATTFADDGDTPCFEQELMDEQDSYFLCTNPKCAVVFRFGSPALCARCMSPTEERMVIGDFVKHGDSGYTNHGCRCDTCRLAHAAQQHAYRTRKAINQKAYRARQR